MGDGSDVSGLFEEGDEPDFVEQVSEKLEAEAHSKRTVSAAEYVAACRQVWRASSKDKVYFLKRLVDEVVESNTDSQDSPATAISRAVGTADGIYCILYGAQNPEGELIGAGPDYVVPNDGAVRKHVLAIESHLPTEEPPEPREDLFLLAYFDVLGFKSMLARLGADGILGLYRQMFEKTLNEAVKNKRWHLSSGPNRDGSAYSVMQFIPVETAHFSDSLLIWAPGQPAFFWGFLYRVMDVFCEALKIGIPLRGALAIGPAVLHKRTNIFVGPPIVEASSLEAGQDWLGVACGPSFQQLPPMAFPIRADQFLLYDPPMKPGKNGLAGGLALDWPRWWRDHYTEDVEQVITGLRDASPPNCAKYYDAAVAFVRCSLERKDEPFEPPPGDPEQAARAMSVAEVAERLRHLRIEADRS